MRTLTVSKVYVTIPEQGIGSSASDVADGFSLCLPKCDTEERKRCSLLLPYVWLSAHARPIIEGVTLRLAARTWKAVLAIAITLMVVGK